MISESGGACCADISEDGPELTTECKQTVAFALGAFVLMPAVRNFALCAALSVLVNIRMPSQAILCRTEGHFLIMNPKYICIC